MSYINYIKILFLTMFLPVALFAGHGLCQPPIGWPGEDTLSDHPRPEQELQLEIAHSIPSDPRLATSDSQVAEAARPFSPSQLYP